MKDMNSMKVILYTCNRMDICQTSKTAYLCDICEDIYNFTELKLMRNKFKKWMIYLLRKHVVKDDRKREQRDNKTLKLCYLNWWNSMWIAFQDLVIYWGYKKCVQASTIKKQNTTHNAKNDYLTRTRAKKLELTRKTSCWFCWTLLISMKKCAMEFIFKKTIDYFERRKENTSKLTCLTV